MATDQTTLLDGQKADLEDVKLGLCGQVAEHHAVGDLQEVGTLSQLLNGEATVAQDALLAINERDVGDHRSGVCVPVGAHSSGTCTRQAMRQECVDHWYGTCEPVPAGIP